MDQQTLVGLGCDYITAIADDSGGLDHLHSYASGLFRFEAETGNKVRGWGMAGFKGFKCGDVEIGLKDGDVLVRLSSATAGRSWRGVAERARSISRLDIQATVLVPSGPTRLIDRHRRTATRHAARLDHKPVVRWTADNRGGYTLYLGARTSVCFGRIYDKYQHTKLDHFRNCVRFELQMHNELAYDTAMKLMRLPSPRDTMAAHVNHFFARRDIKVGLPTKVDGKFVVHRSRSDVDTNLKWLATSVRPTVDRLLNMGHGLEVLQSLGLILDHPKSS